MARRGGLSPGGNLPAELSSFVGRRRELEQVKRLTSEYRLVTLCGIGGVGKTRLALQAAAWLRRTFPDGSWFVDLAEFGRIDPAAPPAKAECDALAHLVAGALGPQELAPRTPLDSLCGRLASRCLLLVLDNCEHVLPAVAAVVRTLLRRCPDMRIVATSREPLGIIGEVAFLVPPMPAHDPAARPELADVLGFEATALFTARAEAVVPGFRLTGDNCAAVADICHRLDGLPLAIELAAARLRVLAPEQIAARLTDRFALLGRGNRGAPDRQRTLWGCVDWSFELCDEAEQRLWARLSIFAGPFEVDAIEGVCAGDGLDRAELLDRTAALLDKSILTGDDGGPVVRYRMLETIRAYGRERLRDGAEEPALARRHRDWYTDLVERAGAEWLGDRQSYWLRRLNHEHANLRAALDACVDQEAERALRILVRLPALYWWGRGMFHDGRGWLDRALAVTTAPTTLRSRALLLAGRMAFAQRDLDAWQRLMAEGEELGRRLDDAVTLAYATFLRGTVALFENDVPAAVEILEESLAILDRSPEPELDHRLHILFTLVAAAGLAGDEKRATACYEEVLAIAEPLGEGFHRSNAMWAFGLAAWRQGDLGVAAAQQEAGLRLKQARGIEDPLGTALCLEVLAWVETGRQPRRAAVLLGAVDAQWTRHGSSLNHYPHLIGHRKSCEQRTRRVLGEPAFRDAYRHGRGLSHAESLAYALSERRRPDAEEAPAGPTPLTRREHEVAVLVARGLSNRDIAKSLVISQRTAESHVANILTKRGFTSRSQVAAWISAPAQGHPVE